MKVFTLGWISVFLMIGAMNIYIWTRYWKIPFTKAKMLKLNSYLGLHILLVAASLYYFYILFNGRIEKKKTRLLSYLASFYITFLHYSVIFHFLYDLLHMSRNIISYPIGFKIFIEKIFFGGFLIYGICGLISLVSIINSKRIIIKEYRLKSNKRKSSLDRLNIVYISDAHIGTCIKLNDLDGIIDDINSLQPDIVFLGGDFFDEGTSNTSKFLSAKKLSGIKSKYGIIAVEGNHEYKSNDGNIEREMEYFSNVDIKVLQDDYVNIQDEFYILGRRDRYGGMASLESLMEGLDKDLPIILLDHRPSYKESSNYDKINLQISGHTHSGQFFPFQIFEPLVMKIKKEFIYGHHQIGPVDYIVSSGLGNWGIPARLGSTREIVNIKIEFE